MVCFLPIYPICPLKTPPGRNTTTRSWAQSLPGAAGAAFGAAFGAALLFWFLVLVSFLFMLLLLLLLLPVGVVLLASAHAGGAKKP